MFTMKKCRSAKRQFLWPSNNKCLREVLWKETMATASRKTAAFSPTVSIVMLVRLNIEKSTQKWRTRQDEFIFSVFNQNYNHSFSLQPKYFSSLYVTTCRTGPALCMPTSIPDHHHTISMVYRDMHKKPQLLQHVLNIISKYYIETNFFET